MKKLSVGIVTSLCLCGTLTANQNISLNSGWNLVGDYVETVDLTKVKMSNVKIMWKFVDGEWKVYSPNEKIKAVIEKSPYSSFVNLSSGEGFWVNANTNTTLSFSGEASNKKLTFKDGWSLLSLTSDKSMSVEKFPSNVQTIWKWDSKNQKWMVYSSNPKLQSIIAVAVKAGKYETFDKIEAGEGFWVYSNSNANDISTPPTIGFVYSMVNKLNSIPLDKAGIYVNGKKVATTDSTGKFLLNLKNGTEVIVKKKGYATAYGVVKDGKVVILTQQNNNEKVLLSATNGNQKIAKKGITSQDGTVNLIISKLNLKQDITTSVIPFKSVANAPTLNDITMNGESVPANQLAIIGGANINVENSSGGLLNPTEVGTADFEITTTSILGDLDDILNGTFDESAQKFSADAFKKFTEMTKEGIVDILVLQFENGKWVYRGKGKLVEYKKLKKLLNGKTKTVSKYKLASDTTLTKLEPTAFVLKMNYLIGETTICSKNAGFKMFDGSIVTSDDSNSKQFDWLNTPIPSVTVIGDDAVTSGATLTGKNGCSTISYKVPFLKPTFNIALKKDGYYDTEVSCEVDFKGAKCDSADMYKIPDTASIEGYVLNKVTNNGIKDALVTLENPEVLSAKKIKVYDKNGTSSIEVGYMPNVTYTWTAVKYDEQNKSKVVVSKVIKTGKGDSKYAHLSETEIFKTLVEPFEKKTNTFKAKYLTGNWELRVKAEHKFTNNASLTEEAIGKFDIDLLMTKLASLMSNQISEKHVLVDENGNEAKTNIKTASIYGGFSLGFLYEFGAQNDKFEWQTALLGDATDLSASTGVVCNDYNSTNVSKCEADPLTSTLDENIAYLNVAKGDVLTYKKSLYPMGLNVKFMAKHFPELLNADPESEEGDPFIKSGFTIRTMFKGEIDIPQSDGTSKTYTQYLGSYADISGAKSVKDVLDIPQISLVGASATAYMRHVITQKDDGYYRINMIPPSLSGGLEIFAKAEGYKFDENADIKLVNDLEKGKVSKYDLYLEPTKVDVTKTPKPVGDSFDKWSFSNKCNDNVKWQVVTSPTDIVASGDWANTVWGDSVSLLPDADTNTNGYLWFGDKKTGMFSDTSKNTSSSAVCGTVVTPTIDLANYSFPVLTFRSWFEVESVDVAKNQYDQMNVEFMIPSSENGDKKEVVLYNSFGDKVTVKTDTYYPLTKLNPDSEPAIQQEDVPYTSAGLNVLPIWKNYKVSAEGLAGYKVKFAFNFKSVDSLFNGFRGWGIDTVKVSESMQETLSMPPMVPSLDEASTLDKKVR